MGGQFFFCIKTAYSLHVEFVFNLKRSRTLQIDENLTMGSRHLQGTVFTRVKALCASGALKKKPVWFDVMEAFPPLVQMKLKDIPGEGRPPVIRYQEDEIRDIFYEKFPLLHKVPINFIEKENVTQTATHRNKLNAKPG